MNEKCMQFSKNVSIFMWFGEMQLIPWCEETFVFLVFSPISEKSRRKWIKSIGKWKVKKYGGRQKPSYSFYFFKWKKEKVKKRKIGAGSRPVPIFDSVEFSFTTFLKICGHLHARNFFYGGFVGGRVEISYISHIKSENTKILITLAQVTQMTSNLDTSKISWK